MWNNTFSVSNFCYVLCPKHWTLVGKHPEGPHQSSNAAEETDR